MTAERFASHDDDPDALVEGVLELIPPGWRPDVKGYEEGYEDELDSVDESRAFAYLRHLAQRSEAATP